MLEYPSDTSATQMGSCDLLLHDATLPDGSSADIAVREGLIVAVRPNLTLSAASSLDLEHRVVLPGLVDLHTHLDKTLTVIQARNESGTLAEALVIMGTIQRTFTRESVRERALRMARASLAAGVTAMRSHVDVNDEMGLIAVEALLEVRAVMRGMLDLQLVTLNCRLAGAEGARNRERIEEALRIGVDAVGGAPALDSDPHAHIDAVFALAERYDKPIDLHMDESDDPRDFFLPYLAEKTIASGYQGRVVAGHCCALSAVDRATAARTIERVLEANITVVTLPSANMYLQGRGDDGCVRRGITRVRELLAAGVPVACGSDNVRDPFNPFGRGDLLLVGNLLAHAAHLGSPRQQETVLEAITTVPAQAMGLARHGLRPGCAADLVVCDSTDPLALLAEVPSRRYVLKAGSVVAETRVDQRFYDRIPVAGAAH